MLRVVLCCTMLRCVAPCCVVLHYVALCCTMLRCVALCCVVLHYVALCCTMLRCVALCCIVLRYAALGCTMLRCVALCWVVLHYAALCCTMLHCIALCCVVLHYVSLCYFMLICVALSWVISYLVLAAFTIIKVSLVTTIEALFTNFCAICALLLGAVRRPSQCFASVFCYYLCFPCSKCPKLCSVTKPKLGLGLGTKSEKLLLHRFSLAFEWSWKILVRKVGY